MLRKRESNTVVSLVTNYICTIWYNREYTRDKLHIPKKYISSSHSLHKTILKKMPKTFKDNYCQMNHDFLEDVPHVNNVTDNF